MLEGIIVKGIGGFYYVKTAEGQIIECRAKGSFRKEKIKPVVGDYVKIENGSIREITPRKCELIRPPVANIDMLMLVVAATSPEPNLFLIDKLLVYAESLGVEAVICINKTDLQENSEIKEIYEKAGYKVISVSAYEEKNIFELKALLKDRVTAFAGLSGVGKSSLLNLLTKEEMKTGDLSEKINRGKHTTRHVELLELIDGGYVFDTPGFSSFEVLDFGVDKLAGFFREFPETGCRFKGCSHISEPDCVVREMLLKGEIAQSRYESYEKLYNVLKNKKDWETKE